MPDNTTKKEIEFNQVGRTVECSNCHPEKRYLDCGLVFKEHGVKCQCVCHEKRCYHKCFSKDCDSSLNIATIYCAHHFYEKTKEAEQSLLTNIKEWTKANKVIYPPQENKLVEEYKRYNRALFDLENYLIEFRGTKDRVLPEIKERSRERTCYDVTCFCDYKAEKTII